MRRTGVGGTIPTDCAGKSLTFWPPSFSVQSCAPCRNVADRLHDNNYEGSLHNWQIAADLADVTRWLESLVEVRALGANVDFEPSEEQSRAINRLRLSEAEADAISMIDWPPPMPPFDPDAD